MSTTLDDSGPDKNPLWEVQESGHGLVGSWLHECCKHCTPDSHHPHTRGCPVEPAPQMAPDQPTPTRSETLYAASQMLAQAGFKVDYAPPDNVSIVHGGDNPAMDSVVQILTSASIARPTVECVMCYTQNKSTDAQYVANGHSVCAAHVDEVIEAG